MVYPTAATAGQYAGFWKRFAAWLFVDAIIIGIATYPIQIFLGVQVGSAAAFIISWLYFAFMESSKEQATVGKIALGIIVTDINGNRISFARATGRYLAKILSALVFLVGYLMVAFTEKKQGLHDMMAGTLVVRKR